ncbi:MAG: AI-2E family transporter [Candidatus Marinimicrobia bacterium]|nr:AI-2E family transporter [Candidatus Neomarinimicrobiota bacterium]
MDRMGPQNSMDRYLRDLLILAGFCIAIFFMRELRHIFIPLVLAVFFAFLFSPITGFLSRKGVPNFLIILLLLVIVSVFLFLVGTVVYASISSFVSEFPKYQERFILAFQDILLQLKIPMEDAEYFFKDKVNWFEIADRIFLQKFITATMGSFFDFIVSVILVVLILLFIIAERKSLEERLEALILNFKTKKRPEIIPEIQKKIQTFISRKTIISLGTAISAMVIASFFKLDFIIVIGLITFLLNFIPSIGSIIATIFPMLIYLLQYGFEGRFILVSALFISSQFLFGNILDPRYLGHGLKLSPLFIIVSLFFWHWLWGPIGMIICVPLQSVIGLILQYTGGSLILRSIMGEKLPTDRE